MRILHVSVESEDGWFIGQGLEEPGVITQARTLDDLLANVRDAASLLLGVKSLHVELILPPAVAVSAARRTARPQRRKAG